MNIFAGIFVLLSKTGGGCEIIPEGNSGKKCRKETAERNAGSLLLGHLQVAAPASKPAFAAWMNRDVVTELTLPPDRGATVLLIIVGSGRGHDFHDLLDDRLDDIVVHGGCRCRHGDGRLSERAVGYCSL